VSLPVDL